jgi:hypothetical protein
MVWPKASHTQLCLTMFYEFLFCALMSELVHFQAAGYFFLVRIGFVHHVQLPIVLLDLVVGDGVIKFGKNTPESQPV